jgi:hypothetical protein
LLADVFALYLKTKNFHWHVPGRHFREHHLLLRGAHGKVNRPVWHPTNVAKTAFEQVECGFMFGPRAPSGPETHNNVKDKTETGRDSVGL